MIGLKQVFDAVIFDMDGLLLDSERIAQTAFNQTLAELDLPADDALFMKTVGTNAAACKQILREGLSGKIDDPDTFGKAWFQRYKQTCTQDAIPLKPGTKELLLHLQSINLPTAVATSTNTDLAIIKLKNAKIIDFFIHVVGGDQVSKGKPDPEIYRKAVADMAATPERALALEDSENGVKAAVAAGLKVVQIPDIVSPSESLRQLGHIVLDNLNQVITYDFS